MASRKRTFAFLLCISMVLMLLVSSVYLVNAAGHTCEDSHCCEICHVMVRTEALLSAFVFFAVVLLLGTYSVAELRETISESIGRFSLPLTLVSRKVQLNN